MKTRLILCLLLCIGLASCTPDFQHPHYKKKSLHGWKRKRVIIFKQDTYRNPSVKKEARQKMIKPPQINLDEW